MFGSSLDKYNLRYTEYLGDGDIKSYHLVNSKPYDDIPVKKLECIGHIQRGVWARLLKTKNGDFKELCEDDEDSKSKKRKKTKSPYGT